MYEYFNYTSATEYMRIWVCQILWNTSKYTQICRNTAPLAASTDYNGYDQIYYQILQNVSQTRYEIQAKRKHVGSLQRRVHELEYMAVHYCISTCISRIQSCLSASGGAQTIHKLRSDATKRSSILYLKCCISRSWMYLVVSYSSVSDRAEIRQIHDDTTGYMPI